MGIMVFIKLRQQNDEIFHRDGLWEDEFIISVMVLNMYVNIISVFNNSQTTYIS